MRYKTKASFLGGPSILVGWVFFAPILIPFLIIKAICRR